MKFHATEFYSYRDLERSVNALGIKKNNIVKIEYDNVGHIWYLLYWEGQEEVKVETKEETTTTTVQEAKKTKNESKK